MKKAKFPFLTLLIKILLEILVSAIRPDKEIKGMKVEKEEIKLFIDIITVYVENVNISTKIIGSNIVSSQYIRSVCKIYIFYNLLMISRILKFF